MTDSADSESLLYVEPTVKVHTFHDKIMDKDAYFSVTKLTDSFHLWIGRSGAFGDLSVAMTMRDSIPSATVLIGGSVSPCQAMAERLSKRTGKQVFVGGDLNSFSQLEIPLVEKRVAEEMKKIPEAF